MAARHQPPEHERENLPRIPFLTKFIATGCYAGYAPVASGTAGSLVGLLLYSIPGAEQPGLLLVLIAAGFVAGVITSATVAAAVGNELTDAARRAKEFAHTDAHGTPDPSIVVIDEIVGMWVSLIFLPKSFPVAVLAFLLFRAFDILKPPPARQAERLPRGWGIMLDDVAAGVYANICCRLLLLLVPAIA
jgi:phosphatidylglycerophosphatase A